MFISIGILRLSKVVRSLKLPLHKNKILRLIEAYEWLKKDKMNAKASVPFSFASLYQALLWAPTVLSPLVSCGQSQRSSFFPFRLPMLHWSRKWQPTAVFLPGKSCGQRSWWAAVHGIAKSRTQLSNWAHTHSDASTISSIPSFWFSNQTSPFPPNLSEPVPLKLGLLRIHRLKFNFLTSLD